MTVATDKGVNTRLWPRKDVGAERVKADDRKV